MASSHWQKAKREIKVSMSLLKYSESSESDGASEDKSFNDATADVASGRVTYTVRVERAKGLRAADGKAKRAIRTASSG